MSKYNADLHIHRRIGYLCEAHALWAALWLAPRRAHSLRAAGPSLYRFGPTYRGASEGGPKLFRKGRLLILLNVRLFHCSTACLRAWGRTQSGRPTNFQPAAQTPFFALLSIIGCCTVANSQLASHTRFLFSRLFAPLASRPKARHFPPRSARRLWRGAELDRLCCNASLEERDEHCLFRAPLARSRWAASSSACDASASSRVQCS